jgi:large subunit ribosomal protein L10
MSKQILAQKANQVEEIKKLLQDYKILGIANLQKVRAAQLQEINKKLKDIASIRVIKNTLMKRAIAECDDKPTLEKLEPMLTGANITLFTNLNPFKLSLLLEKSRVKATAKAGDIAAADVVVPGGNTGLAPGPIISQLGSVGLPTRIEAGSVWVNKDTLVAKKGDIIDARLATVLSKLNIKPVEVGLMLKVVYDDGFLITEEQLHLDLQDLRKSFVEAQSNALHISLNSGYPLPENISLLLQTTHTEAFNLALNARLPTKETMPHLLGKAHLEALRLREKVEEKAKDPAAHESGKSSI